MKIIQGNIAERDADFAIIHGITTNENVFNIFLNKINETGNIVKIYHSLVQIQSQGGTGESDIVIVCEDPKKRFAIFIEDKINADAQKQQRERYDDRANELKKQGEFDRYYVILCAPQKYLETSRADGYSLLVSYEELLGVMSDELEISILSYACEEKSIGYTPIRNEVITTFWDSFYLLIEKNYPNFRIKKISRGRGNSAVWPIFTTSIKKVWIYYKSDRNYIDLTFIGMKSNRDRISSFLKTLDISQYELVDTRKSIMLRYSIPKQYSVKFDLPFNEQLDNIKYCLDIIDKLYSIVRLISFENDIVNIG